MTISESTVHQAIKPFLSQKQQGKVMGALRQIIDMDNPRIAMQVALHTDAPGQPQMASRILDAVQHSKRQEAVSVTFMCAEWYTIAQIIHRDSEVATALRRTGLQLMPSPQGLSVKPIARQNSILQ